MRTCGHFDSAIDDVVRRLREGEPVSQLEHRCKAIGAAYGVRYWDVACLVATDVRLSAMTDTQIRESEVWQPC